MQSKMHLALLLAFGSVIALAGCSGDDEPAKFNGGGSTGKGGSGSGAGGKASGGAGGSAPSGGSANGGSAGSTGNAGTAGNGTGGSAGSAGGNGGNGGGAGSAGNGQGGTAGSAGSGGSGGNVCEDDEGAAGAGGDGSAGSGNDVVTTAVVLLDSVIVKDASNTNVVVQWLFDNANDIVDSSSEPRPGDKWTRTPYSPIGTAAGAHDTLFMCDGNPANGSLRNVAPFTANDQYYELSVPFAQHDYSNHHVTAKVKLVRGGRPDAACPARAELYTIHITDGFPIKLGPAVVLVEGQWLDLTLDIAADVTAIDQIGFHINTYGCG